MLSNLNYTCYVCLCLMFTGFMILSDQELNFIGSDIVVRLNFVRANRTSCSYC